MLETKSLTYQYPDSAPLQFPDLRVEAGRPLLIYGESGCGKTTLLHLLAGLKQPTTGQLTIAGSQLANLSAAKLDQFRGQYIGMVYQQSYFIDSLSVLDNLLLSPYVNSKPKAVAVAKRLGIANLLTRRPSQLSVGQQQRMSIVRAVMNQPKLILADEPTSALDNKNCTQVINLLLEEAATNEAALVIVTHDDRLRQAVANSIDLSPAQNGTT